MIGLRSKRAIIKLDCELHLVPDNGLAAHRTHFAGPGATDDAISATAGQFSSLER